MSHHEPNITVNVDVTNPGQFFACCGLLELADRLWPGAEVVGGFTLPRFYRARFQVYAKMAFSSGDLMTKLLTAPRNAVDPYQAIMGSNGKPVADANKTKPVVIGEPVSLRLGWWLDELTGRQTRFKMWGAHQTSDGLIGDMANAINADEMTDTTVLQSRLGMTGRIGSDTRSSWNTLDEGFSPNDQTLPVDTYPATELLAAIGLETFRPTLSADGCVYACWFASLPTLVARAVASGSVTVHNTHRYRFAIGERGKFKFFTNASPLEGDPHA
jgi:CRISPR-associated protein Csx14